MTDTERMDDDRRTHAEEALWSAVGVFLRWRRFIAIVTGSVAVLAVVISLLLPNEYAASARLLAPESSGTSPLSAALSSSLSAAASALLGGSSGDYVRYISILTSRTMMENVAKKFDLITVYGTSEEVAPLDAAVGILSAKVSFTIDNEYDFLSVVVRDQDPQRAADMANFFVSELNARNMALASQDAALYRSFVQVRYEETLAALDSLKRETQEFQERYGVFNIEAQVAGLMEQMASIRAEAIALEINYNALRVQYGPDNPTVEAAREAFALAERKSTEALDGQDAIFPVAQKDIPTVLREYLDLEQQIRIQGNLLEFIAPLNEQARFQQERVYQAVQIVDEAVPPSKKAAPKRSVICVAATLSAFLLAALFAFASEWWTRHAGYISTRLDEARRA